MEIAHLILIVAKHAAAIVIIMTILFAPAWLARQTKRDKQAMIRIRLASWLFGWTVVGWLYALFQAAKK